MLRNKFLFSFLLVIPIFLFLNYTVAVEFLVDKKINEKFQDGLYNMMDPNSITNTISSLIIIGENENAKIMRKKRENWSAENVETASKFLEHYFKRYQIVIDSSKYDLILRHLKQFTAFKASVYSSLPRGEEVGQMVAAEVARGIKYVNREDVVYPSHEEREKSVAQINDILSTLKELFLQKTHQIALKKSIEYEFDKYFENLLWRVDSPFHVTGKRIFSKEEFSSISDKCLNRFKIAIQGYKTSLPDPLQGSSKLLQMHYHGLQARKVIISSIRPFTLSYAIGMNRGPSVEEVEEMRLLAERAEKRKMKN